jgi:hypothetical protein
MEPIMRSLFLLAAFLAASVSLAQDTPPAPEPTVLAITGPDIVEEGSFIDFEAVGGSGEAVRWRFINIGSATRVPLIRNPIGEDGKPNLRKLEVSYLPGTWTLEVLVSDSKQILDDSHTFTISGAIPPDPGPDPPIPVKTLAQLAGDKAAPLGQMYAVLLESLGKDITTVEQFPIFEREALAANGLTGHGATAEIARRLSPPKKIEDLRAALTLVIAELGKPPTPPPGPAPIPVAGLHVLIVEETDDRGRIPQGQLAVLQTTQIQELVKSKNGQFRQYDDDPEITDPIWKAARNRPRTALPWIIVSNGSSGVEQPLPATIEETLALIGRFAQ